MRDRRTGSRDAGGNHRQSDLRLNTVDGGHRLSVPYWPSFPDIEDHLEASAEDREGLAPCKHQTDTQTKLSRRLGSDPSLDETCYPLRARRASVTCHTAAVLAISSRVKNSE